MLIDSSQRARKPIYDDPTKNNPSLSEPLPPSSETPADNDLESTKAAPSEHPTPTDRVTVQVRRARQGLYNISTQAEAGFNNFLSRAFNAEHNFTSTIRSLAPPPEADEPLLPGFVYTLVGTLAGSILVRNRGLLLRFSVPLAFGIGTARYTLPYTSQNVGNLVWKYEERYPALAQAHLQTRARIQRFWETGKSHAQMSAGVLGDKVVEARDSVEDWVKKGK